MEWANVLNIVFGAFLGLAISFVHDAVRTFKERRNTERHIRSELSAVIQSLNVLAGNNENNWPVTETPTLSPLSPASAGVLPYETSSKVVKVQWGIKMGNELRLKAIDAARLGHNDERETYAFACNHWLRSAKEDADELAKLLKAANK